MENRARDSLLALRRIFRAMEDTARARARASGLTQPQLAILQIVAEAGEPTPSAIARTAGITPPTATALIEKLTSRGFLTRRRSETDRRQLRVALTPAGCEALASGPMDLPARLETLFETIPDWEQAMILAGVERLAALLAEHGAHAAPPEAAPILPVASGLPEEDARRRAPEPPGVPRRPRAGLQEEG